MTENSNAGLRKIHRVLISVSDKTGIVDFALELKRFGVQIISTGGTAKTLREAGIDVLDVSEVTGFPEMMDGRVKTLHPKIHGALLAVRDIPGHEAALRDHDIEPIDMVVVNLYPFEETIARQDVTPEEAIEQIDIGGPAMVRSAAKNFRYVSVLTSPDWYQTIQKEMKQNSGAVSLATRQELALQAFQQTKEYDEAVSLYLLGHVSQTIDQLTQEDETSSEFPTEFDLFVTSSSTFAMGKPSSSGRAIQPEPGRRSEDGTGIAQAEILAGKEMSFNNYVDADAAWQLVSDFAEPACAIIKHTNPAGAALGTNLEVAYRRALACDPVSAFGGIVAFNRRVDVPAARAVVEIFIEVVIAPDYEESALDVLKTKKNLRVLRAGYGKADDDFEYKQISGGMLAQSRDDHRMERADLKVVTKREPSEKEIDDLLFAWSVCKHTKSNAIVYARDKQTVGVGAGQMSRVDSVKIGAMRAQLAMKDSVMASDAFFPFRDGIDEAAKHGITAVIQPGGSVRDEETIAAADEHGLAMVFTGVRHFKH